MFSATYVQWLSCADQKIARRFRDSYDLFDKGDCGGSLRWFCVALPPRKISSESELID
jgi:hypothetical protein